MMARRRNHAARILFVIPMTPSTFQRVDDLDAFFGEPARRYVVKRSFAYWQAERRAFGIVIWGRPDENDVDEICAAHEVGADPLFRGHTSLVDLRSLESVDLLAFARLLAYLKKRRDAWSPMVTQQVVLHRGTIAHATVAGMFQFFAPTHPVAFLGDAVEAYAAVGASDVGTEIESLPARASVAEIARRSGMSLRSLQRGLQAAGTSLRAERQEHLVREAERLLEQTELDLDAIAAQVGASSAPHLVTLVRQHRGTTPGALRDARRSSLAER